MWSSAEWVKDLSDAKKGLCTDHQHANLFLRTTVGRLHGLSFKDTEQNNLM